MAGGSGSDTYMVDSVADIVAESSGAGADLVLSSVTHTLTLNVENLTLTGGAGINGTGNDIANVITGNQGDNSLSSLAGNDTINGGDGHDTINGGTGSDSMTGGEGNDTFVVDSAGDVVVEASGEGTDTVQSSIAYVLSANLEHLTLTGSNGISGTGNEANNNITGNSGSNVLTGLGGNDSIFANGGNDTLDGGNGNDTLDGGAGNDSMTGGAGNDVYVVGSAGDAVVEAPGGGTDTVQSSIAYVLGVDLERLTLTGAGNVNGTGNATNNIIAGNTGNNLLSGLGGNDTISGGEGNDTLDGGVGLDSMTGGAGNDTYVVDSAGDGVSEALGEGTDLVQASVAHTLGSNVENLTLTGAADIDGTGNGLDNAITGNSGNNELTGSGGNDTLTGGAGTDTLTGGTGDDVFDWNLIAESAVGPGHDRVEGFTGAGAVGGDAIDVSGIDANTGSSGNQAFVFIGTAAFSATGQLRVADDGLGNTLVQGDVNGGGADFEILVVGVSAATFLAGDFVL